MSITRGVLAQSPEPEAHDKVLDNNPDRIGIWKCWFLRRGGNRSTRRKTSKHEISGGKEKTHVCLSFRVCLSEKYLLDIVLNSDKPVDVLWKLLVVIICYRLMASQPFD